LETEDVLPPEVFFVSLSKVATAVLSFAAQSVYVLLVIRMIGGIGNTSFDISQKETNHVYHVSLSSLWPWMM
jgi:hypothetical protein